MGLAYLYSGATQGWPFSALLLIASWFYRELKWHVVSRRKLRVFIAFCWFIFASWFFYFVKHAGLIESLFATLLGSAFMYLHLTFFDNVDELSLAGILIIVLSSMIVLLPLRILNLPN